MKTILTPTDYAFVQHTILSAGKILLKTSNSVLHEKRDALDLVTRADLDSEQYLRSKLTKRFSNIGFYSEESAKESEDELKKDLVWVVDPLDGTLQFSRGLPFYGVSIGLMHEGRGVAGFLCFPVFNELYHAQKGSGAFLGKTKIHIANREYPTKTFGVLSYIGLSDSQQIALHTNFIKEKLTMLRIGSSIFHLAHTAAGQYDLYVGINQAYWDVAGGWAIIEEAGGKVEVCQKNESIKSIGNPYHYSLIAANNEIVSRLRGFIKKI